jgi:hypothetical protein
MRPRFAWMLLVVFGAAGLITGARAQEPQQLTVTLELLLGRGAWYVEDFLDRFSNVVAQEVYVQDSSAPLPSFAANSGRGATPVAMNLMLTQVKHRVLRSDFLLVALNGQFDWVPFRDVLEVDDLAVRDREVRLEKLFLEPSADSVQQAERIRDESSRFNLGTMRRTINNPVLALAVLRADFQQRFRYTLGKKDPTVGPEVWTIDYREEQSPTLIKGRSDGDLFSHGRLWIDAETGRLLKSELAVEQPALGGRVTSIFRYDERFGIAVPQQMQEDYRLDNGTRVTAVATYDRFRRFGVTAEDSISK